MTYRRYFFILAVMAAIGWVSFILVIYKLEPCTSPGEVTLCNSASTPGIMFFFLSGFFALTATFTLLGFAMRFWLNRHEMYLDYFSVSLRQGILLAFCTLCALVFLMLKVLTWWSGLLLIMIIMLVELYFSLAG